MKYIKSYEESNQSPQIGDYVICKNKVVVNSIISNILTEIVGKIVLSFINDSNTKIYCVEFDEKKIDKKIEELKPKNYLSTSLYFNKVKDVWTQMQYMNNLEKDENFTLRNDDKLDKLYLSLNSYDIEFYSPNKSDCEAFIISKQFNL